MCHKCFLRVPVILRYSEGPSANFVTLPVAKQKIINHISIIENCDRRKCLNEYVLWFSALRKPFFKYSNYCFKINGFCNVVVEAFA